MSFEMIFFLLFLAFSLSSAKPTQDVRRTGQGASLKTDNLRHTANDPRKFDDFDNETKDSKILAQDVSRFQGSLPSRAPSIQEFYNDLVPVEDSVAVTFDRSGHYSLPSTKLHMLHIGEDSRVRTSESIAETILRRDNQIKLVRFTSYSVIVPATIAAVQLRVFFDAVAWEATHHWPTTRERSALFTITQGQFQLTMSCLGGEIPWPVLASAARRFSLLATHLFVYTFDAYYMDVGTFKTVAVSLRLLGDHFIPRTRGLQPLPKGLHRRGSPSEELSISSKRTTPLPNGPIYLSMTKFRTFTALLPTALAIAKLEDFYNLIALKIMTGEFAQLAPAKMMILGQWDFELIISCDKMNVPWSFVEAFCVDMAAASARMFTGFYEATVRGEGPLSGLVFLIKMRLKDTPRI